MRRLYSLLFLLYSLVAVAQKEDYNWVISDPFIVRFNNDTIVGVDTFNIQPNRVLINTSYTCNDSDGNLLFYTDGVSIYDKTGAIMQGCDTFLSPSSYTSGLIGIGGGSSQGIVGFRKPGSANEYYVFYATSGDCNGPFVTDAPCVFFYALIDMSRNNGLGEVVSLNIPVSSDSNSFYSPSAINACRHANGIDWWIVLGKAYDRTAYEIYKVDKTGVSFHDTQFIGDTCSLTAPVGRLVFDPTGQKMARAAGVCAWSLFDFNRCSGVLSNTQNISTYRQDSVADYPVATNIAFSSNGRFAYVNTLDKLFQYDITSSNIKSSEVLIWQLDTLSFDYTILVMQLAPDNRIYVGPWWSSSDRKYLSVINKPNEKGIACDFRLGGVPFSNMIHHGNGIPNMPNFRLGASPVYQMQAGANRTICKDSTTQLGSAQKVNELIYNWSSTDPVAYISDVHSHSPTVSTTADEALFIVDVVDTVSRLTCLERSDTVVVKTYTCYPNQLDIPTIIKSGSHPYLVIPNLAVGTQVSVYNVAGQLMYQSADYQNNWDARIVANGVYVVATRMSNGHRQNGKVVVVE